MTAYQFTACFCLSLLWTLAAIAQGTFSFRNYDPAHGIDVPVFDALGNMLVGTNYRAELWGSATPDSLTPLVLIDDGNRREILSFNERGRVLSASAFLAVLTVPPGGWAWLQMRAWDGRIGLTYEDVASAGMGGYGESPLFHAQGGDPFRIPADFPGPLIGLQSFSLRPVPEPSASALLALGGIVVGWAVRRQRRLNG